MKRLQFEQLIISEDDHFIIINKPPYFSSLDDRHDGGSILRMAKAYHPDAQVCHRLDKETSGVMVIAKHPDAYRHIAMQFEHREIDKVYHAVACGVHDIEPARITVPLTPLQKGIVKIDFAEGKPSETLVRTARVFKMHTLFECKPVTGRMHQIRVHLAYMQAPLIHDTTYGGKTVYLSQLKRKYNLKHDTEELPIINRVALHAYSIKLNHPEKGITEFIAPYPKDFDVLIKLLDKHQW